MTAQFTFDYERTEVERNFTVTDAPIHVTWRKIQMKPEWIKVRFVDGEFWQLVISGKKLRKNGTVGELGASDSFWREDQVPEWAQPLTVLNPEQAPWKPLTS
jgi:hypothetical protein